MVPIQDREPIRAPSNLNESHMETAILINLNTANISTWQTIADSALRATLRGYSSGGNDRYWYFEEKMPGVVFVGFRKNDLYMRVALHIGNHQIKSEIVESKNFSQTSTQIHKNAYFYLQEFEDRLQRSIGEVSRIVTYGSDQTGKSVNLPILPTK